MGVAAAMARPPQTVQPCPCWADAAVSMPRVVPTSVCCINGTRRAAFACLCGVRQCGVCCDHPWRADPDPEDEAWIETLDDMESGSPPDTGIPLMSGIGGADNAAAAGGIDPLSESGAALATPQPLPHNAGMVQSQQLLHVSWNGFVCNWLEGGRRMRAHACVRACLRPCLFSKTRCAALGDRP